MLASSPNDLVITVVVLAVFIGIPALIGLVQQFITRAFEEGRRRPVARHSDASASHRSTHQP
ncbi:MAG: hypothetical protein M9942_03235 [Microthrixaceae bacterium]|nr:hypothetical protein [Microthrixaceae bacterium]